MTQSPPPFWRSLFEVVRATPGFVRAKLRQKTRPCPPHDYGEGGRFGFCVKCGEYKPEFR